MAKLEIKVVRHDTNYSMINLTCVKDERLSLQAKGLHLLLFSLGSIPNWDVNHKHLLKANTNGNRSLQRAVNELKRYGYLTVVSEREQGKIKKWTWTLYEIPPDMQYADVQNADMQNAHYSIKDINNEDINNNTLPKRESYSKEFEDIWKYFPEKVGKKKAFLAFRRAKLSEADIAKLKDYLTRYPKEIERARIYGFWVRQMQDPERIIKNRRFDDPIPHPTYENGKDIVWVETVDEFKYAKEQGWDRKNNYNMLIKEVETNL